MSTMYVNKVQELNVGSGVQIPGHVIQIVEGDYNTQTDITSTSYVDTGLSVTITPKSSSSKVYVITNLWDYLTFFVLRSEAIIFLEVLLVSVELLIKLL